VKPADAVKRQPRGSLCGLPFCGAALASATALVLGLGLGLGGCSGDGHPDTLEPTCGQLLQIAAEDGPALEWLGWYGQTASSADSHEDMLASLADRADLTASPYLPLGNRVAIQFEDSPGNVTLRETPISVDGDVRWGGWQDVELESDDSTVRFEVPVNGATAMSSDSADYLPKSSLRGFVFTVACRAGQDRYAFALRTDPFGLETP
jgi:hypothetical protein